MKHIFKIAIILAAIGVSLPVAAQDLTNPAADDSRKSFQEFRKGLLSDYKSFRKRLLDQYADFLNGEWHEYESLKGEVRDNTPKPAKVPSVAPVSPSAPGVSSNKPDTPSSNQVPKPTPETVRPQIPEPTVKDTDKDSDMGKVGDSDKEEFYFYGLPITIPHIEYNIKQRLSSPSDYAQNWKTLSDSRVAGNVLPPLKEQIKRMNLNDYLIFRFVESYVNGKFPDTDPSARFSVIHYLLANMGYDVRIAATSTGMPLLLLPFKEKVYARTYMMLDGNRYYAFPPDDSYLDRISGERIMTCKLPSDGNLGDKFELQLSDLRIPVKPKGFKFEYGPITLEGEVNENLMPILYKYPQMPIEDYALSVISPDLRNNLANQMKSQLANLNGDEKVEALLTFMHNVFEYATDEDFHGFEKPYFLEETLFYPKNDCEDRAIFYTWFLWNALGREAQLITFPGHESATVEMENPVNGTSYTFDGKRYYVSDPTYIGSKTGMVMPNYRGVQPEVDYTYKR